MNQTLPASSAPRSLQRYAWLSLGAALATIALKASAYFLTGSVGLLSDAAESLVNLLGALTAIFILRIAERPPDDDHHYGHAKAEYFASLIEGVLILSAGAAIAYAAILRLLEPEPLEHVGLGLVLSLVASLLNLAVARVLLRVGRQQRSITLEADGLHLMTDVWTSVGVIVGVALVSISGWLILDPLVALFVALNIAWTAVTLLRRSIDGLMDIALPAGERAAIEQVMATYRERGVEFHALRTRQAASRRFLSVHFLVPGDWSVQRAHDLAETFEGDLRRALGDAFVLTHIEPIEDERAQGDRDEL